MDAHTALQLFLAVHIVPQSRNSDRPVMGTHVACNCVRSLAVPSKCLPVFQTPGDVPHAQTVHTACRKSLLIIVGLLLQVYEKLNAEGRFQEKLLEVYRWGKANGWDAAPPEDGGRQGI